MTGAIFRLGLIELAHDLMKYIDAIQVNGYRNAPGALNRIISQMDPL